MALSKEKKQAVVTDITNLLSDAKLTVVAKYTGTTVKGMQSLRRSAEENATSIRVVKNRLVKKAMESNPGFASADTSQLTGQLLYAFNSEDEVAPAQTLAAFGRAEQTLEFVGAFTQDGRFIGPDDVKALASLPSKDTLRGQLVGTLSAPLSGFINVMSGNVRGIMNVLNARAGQLES